MKVLTLLNGLGMGGAEHMAYELVKNLNREITDAPVFCYGQKLGTPLEDEMSSVTNLQYGNVSSSITLFHMVRMLMRISSYKPDVIHAHMGGVTFGIPWCLLHRKPIVITVHTKPEAAFSEKNQKLIKKALQKKIAFIVAVSEENYKYVKEYYEISEDQCAFVNNGIDIDRFYRTQHQGFTFINVARQDENKNQEAIIRCFASIHKDNPRTSLLLIGDGPLHDKLKKLTGELGLSDCIQLPGLIDKPEIYYAQADAYIQSSHREAMPLSVLEAMATGLPIISTDVGGMRDVVRNNGRLVPDGDLDNLEESMRWVLSVSSHEKEQMMIESKKISEGFSSKKMAQRYQEIYDMVASRRY